MLNKKKAFFQSFEENNNIVHGTSPLLLPDSAPESLSYIKAYGDCTKDIIPDDIILVDYIESSGSQLINTGISIKKVYKFEIVFEINENNVASDMGFIYGGRYHNPTPGSEIEQGFLAAVDYSTSSFFRIDNGSKWVSSYTPLGHTKYRISVEDTVANIYNEDTGTLVATNTFSSISNQDVMLYLMGLNDGATDRYFQGNLRLYECKIWDNNSELIHHFIPAIFCDNSSRLYTGVYDIINRSFNWAQGTSEFKVGRIKHIILPDGYTQKEYIKTIGYGGFDTGIPVKDIYGYDLRFKIEKKVSTSSFFFGGRTSGYTGIIIGYDNNDTLVTFDYLGSTASDRYNASPSFSEQVNYHVNLYDNKLNVYNESTGVSLYSYTFTSVSRTDTETLAILGYMQGGTLQPSTNCHYQISDLVLYGNNGEILAIYVPVYHSDNYGGSIGFYELVSGMYFQDSSGYMSAGEYIPCDSYMYKEGVKNIGHTQYLNTNIPTKDIYGYEFEFIVNSAISSVGGSIFGGRMANSSGTGLMVGYGNDGSLVVDYFGTSSSDRYAPSSNIFRFEVNTRYRIELKNNVFKLYIYDTLILSHTFTNISRPSVDIDTIIQGIMEYTNSTTRSVTPTRDTITIVYAKFFDQNGVVMFYAVSAENKNEIGMLDLVSEKFLTNQGTGAYIDSGWIDILPYKQDIYCNNGYLLVDNVGVVYTEGTVETLTVQIRPENSKKYLLGNGTQTIDTGVSGTSVYGYDIQFLLTEYIAGGGIIFGARETGKNGSGIILGRAGSVNNNVLYVDWFMNEDTGGTFVNRYMSNYVLIPNVRYRAVMNNNVFTLYNADSGVVLDTHTFVPTHHTVPYTCFVFGNNNGGTAQTYPAGLVVEWLKIYDIGGNLVKDYVPGQIGTYRGLIDQNTGAISVNIVSGARLFQYRPEPENTVLDYIESSGTQYIDTGVLVKDIYKIELSFTVDVVSGSYKSFAGGRETGNGVLMGITNDGFVVDWGSRNIFGNILTANTLYKIIIEDKTAKIYDESTNTIVGSYIYPSRPTDNKSLYLFGINDNGTVQCFQGHAQIRSCKIWSDTNTLVHDFVPVKDDISSVGLYDMNQERLFENAGTGSFTIVESNHKCELLVGINNNKDIHELLSGSVTKNCQILVLDGTENYELYGEYGWLLDTTLGTNRPSYRVLCSHFNSTDVLPGGYNVMNKAFLVDYNGGYTVVLGGVYVFTTKENWKDFLAIQYANGKPVIVIVPLDNATTTMTTPQDIQNPGGDNAIIITKASLDNLELEAEFQPNS